MDPAVEIEMAAMSHIDEIEDSIARGDSSIQRFYCSSTVFITGGSGFIGKQLVEKLFRSCNIKRVYMLLRAKKEHTVEERLQEILKDTVFDPARRQKPGFEDLVVAVQGDISDIRLGVSESDWKLLSKEVDVIFHVAASTKFDEHIKEATFINVRGTRETLLLGKSCKKLRALVHVSTAYSHATSMTRGGVVLEQFYQCPLPPDTLIQMAETIDRERLNDITSTFIKGWPNTYTFTKAVAEELVRLYSSELPVCIVRPSIVISSYREPIPAWLDTSCAFSASGIIIGSGLGLNHVMQTVKGTDLSLVPVDFVNNALIAAGWEVGTRQHNGKRETTVYNMVTSTDNKILWGELENYLLQAGYDCPTPKAVWKSFVITTRYYYMFLLLSLFLHFIPAAILDVALFIFGREPRFIKLYKKIHKLTVSLSYFVNNLHKMDDANMAELKRKLSKSDSCIFNFDMTAVNWQDLVKIWCVGVRKYILKDGLKDTRKAIRKQYWYSVINYVFLVIYCYVFWVIIYNIFRVVFRVLSSNFLTKC